MPFFNSKSLHTQNDLLMHSLMEFYKTREHIETFLNIVQGEDPKAEARKPGSDSSLISLRIIDWFVTNYAKKNFTIYEIVPSTHPVTSDDSVTRIPSNHVNDCVRFKVYNDYKLKLKAYSKKRFDPFCRWERIQLPYTISDTDDVRHLETTIGQLNFFKWVIENHIMDYIQSHYEDVEMDMNARNTNSKHRNRSETSVQSCDSSNTSHSSDVDDVDEGDGYGSKRSTEKNHVFDSPADCSKTRKKREELSISAYKCIKKETVKILVKFS